MSAAELPLRRFPGPAILLAVDTKLKAFAKAYYYRYFLRTLLGGGPRI